MIDQYSWITVYPEIILLALACLIALVDLGVKSAGRTTTYWMTLATLALVAGIQAEYALSGLNQYGFGKLIVSDQMGNWLKCFATLAVLVTLVYGRRMRASATCCVAASCSRSRCSACWASS
jgi:NADH-quinone oxidoreductase subunit N